MRSKPAFYLIAFEGQNVPLFFNRLKSDWQNHISPGCLFQSRIDADEKAPFARDMLNPYDRIEIRQWEEC